MHQMPLASAILRILLLFNICCYALFAQQAKYMWFERFGDVFQFLPLMTGFYTLARHDYIGTQQLALGTGLTLAITFASKYSFIMLADSHPHLASISQRPNHGSFDGFPSGHTSSAFSAAGFLHKRYGLYHGVPASILATLVGISRITSAKHTPLQVLVGALLGYGVGYINASNIHLMLDITPKEPAPPQHASITTLLMPHSTAYIYQARMMYYF